MGAATQLQSACQGLAVGVSLISLFLGLRQWYECRARGELSEADRSFHHRQNVRRWLGVAALAGMALVMFAGSWVHPRVDGRGNVAFVVVWLAVLSLIVLTLLVALWDWAATWQYARERRRTMIRDHVDELRGHLRAVADAARRERESTQEDAPPADA